jgi:hypothetical protein
LNTTEADYNGQMINISRFLTGATGAIADAVDEGGR